MQTGSSAVANNLEGPPENRSVEAFVGRKLKPQLTLQQAVRGEIQVRRPPGFERDGCSVVASDMSQGLRLDAQERHCAEPA